MTPKIIFFLMGITAATFAFSGLFFLKFWRSSHDKLFLYFSWACFLMAFERLVGLFLSETIEPIASPATEAISWIYLIRFGAFVLISVAIIDKNRKSS